MKAFERQTAMGSTLPCDSPMLLKMAATSARTACAASTKQKQKQNVYRLERLKGAQRVLIEGSTKTQAHLFPAIGHERKTGLDSLGKA